MLQLLDIILRHDDPLQRVLRRKHNPLRPVLLRVKRDVVNHVILPIHLALEQRLLLDVLRPGVVRQRLLVLRLLGRHLRHNLVRRHPGRRRRVNLAEPTPAPCSIARALRDHEGRQHEEHGRHGDNQRLGAA